MWLKNILIPPPYFYGNVSCVHVGGFYILKMLISLKCCQSFICKSYFGGVYCLTYYFSTVLSGVDPLCGLVVRVSGYRYRGLGFDSRRYQIF